MVNFFHSSNSNEVARSSSPSSRNETSNNNYHDYSNTSEFYQFGNNTASRQRRRRPSTVVLPSTHAAATISEGAMPSCDEMMWLTFEGYWKAFDISEEACGSFGVSYGARIRCLDSTLTIDDFDPRVLRRLLKESVNAITANGGDRKHMTSSKKLNNRLSQQRPNFVAFHESQSAAAETAAETRRPRSNSEHSLSSSCSSSSCSSSSDSSSTSSSDDDDEDVVYDDFGQAHDGIQSGDNAANCFPAFFGNRLVLTVLGVCENDRLWVCADQTGAFPLSLSPNTPLALKKQDELLLSILRKKSNLQRMVVQADNTKQNLPSSPSSPSVPTTAASVSVASAAATTPASLMPPIAILYFGGISMLSHRSAAATQPCVESHPVFYSDTICRMDTHILREAEAELLFPQKFTTQGAYYHRMSSGAATAAPASATSAGATLSSVLTTDLLFETDPHVISKFCRESGLVPAHPFSHVPLVCGRRIIVNLMMPSSISLFDDADGYDGDDDFYDNTDKVVDGNKQTKDSKAKSLQRQFEQSLPPLLQFVKGQRLTIVGVRLGTLYVCADVASGAGGTGYSVTTSETSSSTKNENGNSSKQPQKQGVAFPIPLSYLNQHFHELFYITLHPSDPAVVAASSSQLQQSQSPPLPARPPGLSPVPWQQISAEVSSQHTWFRFPVSDGGNNNIGEFDTFDSSLEIFNVVHGEVVTYRLVSGGGSGGTSGHNDNNNQKNNNSHTFAPSTDCRLQEREHYKDAAPDQDNNFSTRQATTANPKRTKTHSQAATTNSTHETNSTPKISSASKLVVGVVIGVRDGAIWVADLFSFSSRSASVSSAIHVASPSSSPFSTKSASHRQGGALPPAPRLITAQQQERYLRDQDDKGVLDIVLRKIADQIDFNTMIVGGSSEMPMSNVAPVSRSSPAFSASPAVQSFEDEIVVIKQVTASAIFGCKDFNSLEKNVGFKSTHKILSLPCFQ